MLEQFENISLQLYTQMVQMSVLLKDTTFSTVLQILHKTYHEHISNGNGLNRCEYLQYDITQTLALQYHHLHSAIYEVIYFTLL